MDQNNGQKVGQMGMDLGTKMAPLANPVMGGIEAISPIIEYLLQAIGQGQQKPTMPQQQPNPYVGPQQTQQPGGLRQQMMGR